MFFWMNRCGWRFRRLALVCLCMRPPVPGAAAACCALASGVPEPAPAPVPAALAPTGVDCAVESNNGDVGNGVSAPPVACDENGLSAAGVRADAEAEAALLKSSTVG